MRSTASLAVTILAFTQLSTRPLLVAGAEDDVDFHVDKGLRIGLLGRWEQVDGSFRAACPG